MILASVDTWPKKLLDFLEAQHDMLLAHARHDRDTMREYLAPKAQHIPMALMPSNPFSAQRQQAAATVLDLLQSTELRGWHCTRLTEPEVADIRENGMRLPDLQLLRERILQAKANGLIEEHIANRLLTKYQADDQNRKGMLWFCFNPPRLAGQSGIERFFRCWGGEALYNSHEQDLEIAGSLNTIGRPCLIEVDVPVSTFGSISSLGDKVIRRYLLNHGFDTKEDIEHEDKSRQPIPARNIVRFIFRNDAEFTELTGCDKWSPAL